MFTIIQGCYLDGFRTIDLSPLHSYYLSAVTKGQTCAESYEKVLLLERLPQPIFEEVLLYFSWEGI